MWILRFSSFIGLTNRAHHLAAKAGAHGAVSPVLSMRGRLGPGSLSTVELLSMYLPLGQNGITPTYNAEMQDGIAIATCQGQQQIKTGRGRKAISPFAEAHGQLSTFQQRGIEPKLEIL